VQPNKKKSKKSAARKKHSEYNEVRSDMPASAHVSGISNAVRTLAIDLFQTMGSQPYPVSFQQPSYGANTTTQYGGVNLVLPIQQYGGHSPMSSNGLPTNEFLSLKEISENLSSKIDHI
jgi:hypothetical protein